MEANKRTLGEILSPDVRLVAPLFQRPYVWKEDENWEPLWRSLQEVFSRQLLGGKVRPYFLGALVLDQLYTSTGTVPAREIIDGQQRLTTLQVVFKAASDVFRTYELTYEADQLLKLVFNELEEVSDQRFKVWPTNIDREAFSAVMSTGKVSGILGQAYEFFRKRVDGWLSEEPEQRKKRAAAIVAGVKQGLVFVAIDLGNDDEGQLIFETLNALGTPLLPSDLVKNLLFRTAMAQSLDTDQLYLQHWKFLEEAGYWRAEVGVGRQKRFRLDIFLQHYLTLKTRAEVSRAHLFRAYQDAFSSGALGDVVQALEDFARYARIYREFNEGCGTPAARSLRRLLAVMDRSAPMPLVLGILACADPAEVDGMFQAVESYLARRMLGAFTLKSLNKLTVELVERLASQGWTQANLRKALLDQQAHTTRWVDDETVRWAVTSKSAYFTIKSSQIAYVLARVECHLRTSKSETDGTALLTESLSVEHIMPQSWPTHWPLPEGASVEDQRRREALLHYYGNLTILKQRLNSDISNSPWSTKRAKLNDHTVLRLNSELAKLDTWDEEAIKKRSAELADAFCAIWPR